jgi:hypothetical protein
VRALRWCVLAGAVLTAIPGNGAADPVAVRFPEGVTRGFLSLRSLDGRMLGYGDLLQRPVSGGISSRLVFHLHDGSISDETAVFTERGHFRLVRDHSIQRGPAFERPLEMTIDAAGGVVTVRYTDDHGNLKEDREQMKLPPDLANGMIPILLKNLPQGASATWPMVAPTPKPRLVKLQVSDAGSDSFSTAGVARKATHYVLKIDIGGVKGLIAPLVGKQPPDSHIWILKDEVPAFLRAETSMAAGAPLWQIDLVSPDWAKGGLSAPRSRTGSSTSPGTLR